MDEAIRLLRIAERLWISIETNTAVDDEYRDMVHAIRRLLGKPLYHDE